MPDPYSDIMDAAAGKRHTVPGVVPTLIDFADSHGLTVGSTTGGHHNRGSKHYTGEAIDIRGSGGFSNAKVSELKQSATAQGLLVRDERVRPKGQAVWGGPHLHVEVSSQDPYADIVKVATGQPDTPTDPYADITEVASGQAPVSRGAYAARAQQVQRVPDRGFLMRGVPQEPSPAVSDAKGAHAPGGGLLKPQVKGNLLDIQPEALARMGRAGQIMAQVQQEARRPQPRTIVRPMKRRAEPLAVPEQVQSPAIPVFSTTADILPKGLAVPVQTSTDIGELRRSEDNVADREHLRNRAAVEQRFHELKTRQAAIQQQYTRYGAQEAKNLPVQSDEQLRHQAEQDVVDQLSAQGQHIVDRDSVIAKTVDAALSTPDLEETFKRGLVSRLGATANQIGWVASPSGWLWAQATGRDPAKWLRGVGRQVQAGAENHEGQTILERFARIDPNSTTGQIERGVLGGAGAATVELPKLLIGAGIAGGISKAFGAASELGEVGSVSRGALSAASKIAGASNLPVQGALSRADEGLPGIVKGAAGGLVYHYGGIGLGKLIGEGAGSALTRLGGPEAAMAYGPYVGAVGNSLVWIAGPAAEAHLIEGVPWAKAIAEHIPMGVFAGVSGGWEGANAYKARIQVRDAGIVRDATVDDLPAITNKELEVVPPPTGPRQVDVRVPTIETAEAFSTSEGRLRAELERAQAALPQEPLPKGTSRARREAVRQQQAKVIDLQSQLDAIAPAEAAARQAWVESTRYSQTPRFDEWAEDRTGQRLNQLSEDQVQALGNEYRAQYGNQPAPPALREMPPLVVPTGGDINATEQGQVQSGNQTKLRGVRQGPNVPTYGGEVRQEEGGSSAGSRSPETSGQVEESVGKQYHHRDFGQVTETSNQSGLPKGTVRVIDTSGVEHVIKRPLGTGRGNQIAIPVRPASVPNEPAHPLQPEAVLPAASTPEPTAPEGLRQFLHNGQVVTESADQTGAKGDVIFVDDAQGKRIGWVRPTQEVVGYAPRSEATGAKLNVPTIPIATPAKPVRESRAPTGATAQGAQTEVSIPDSDRTYRARYVVREAEDVVPSHNGQNFQPNPDYYHVNDRQYENDPQNQMQVVSRSQPGKFNPRAVVNNSPTVEVGPPVIDADGNVLGGNSRAMIIQRIYDSPDSSMRNAYRQAITDQAAAYGVDPAEITKMNRPVLVRELDDTQLSKVETQRAITELNRTSVTPLTAAEQGTAAASQISEDAASFITDMLDRGGEDATVSSVMDSDGPAIINRLIEDGIIQPGERNKLFDKNGQPTAEAKSRVENILVSSIYRNLKQMEDTPDGVRRNIIRLAVPMRRIARSSWDIAEPVRNAVDAINEARATTGGDLDKLAHQISLIHPPFSPEEIALAKILRLGPRRTASKFRGYANDYAAAEQSGGQATLFGAPTQPESLQVHFGIDSLTAPHPDADVNSRANDVLNAAATGSLGDLSAAIRDFTPEARAQLQGLAAEIAKERSNGPTQGANQSTAAASSEAGPEVPRPDQGTENGPASVSRVPGEPGASDAAGSAGRPLETWAEVNAEVQRRLGETGLFSPKGGGQSGAVGPGANKPFDPLRFPKGGLPDHAKILYALDPVLTKLKMDAANLVAAGKLKAEEVSAYIRDAAKDLFATDPFYSKWNPVNKRAGIAIVARETVPPSSSMDGVRSIIKKARDLGGIEPIPQMSAAGIGGEGREHASARISVPFVVRDLLSRVFPDQYADSKAMAKTVDIIVKDNILDGYDTFMRRGMDAQVKAATAEAAEKAAVKHRKALDKNPPAGLTPKDIGQLKVAANNAISKAHDDAISFRREAVGWLKDADAIQARPDFSQMEADVNAAKSDPKMVANIGRWLAEVNPEMDQLYNEAKRIDPNTPQPGRGRVFGARINLLPETRAAEMAAYSDPNSPMPESVTSNYRNPNVKRDPFMKEAKFTGEYSTDAQAVLTNSFGSRMNEVTKIRLVDAITSRGLGVEFGPGEKPPDLIQGQKPVRLSLKMPVTNENGTTTIAERSLWIRPDLAREVRDVLNTDMALPPSKVYRFLTQIQLAQLTDITAHLKNVISRLASAPMTKAAYTDALRQFPLVGHTDAIRRIVSITREVLSDSPAIRSELAKISQEGYIRPEYPAQGIQKVPGIGKVFRGGQQLIHTVDTAARISLYRAYDDLVASQRVTDTPENRAQYIQAIGEYNRRLMSPIMRAARDYGASPFIVAGKSFNRLGIRMVTGNPSVEASSTAEAAKMRAVNLVSGLVAASVLPAMLNLGTTGSLGGRPGTPIGAWDLGRPEDETGKHRVIDLMQVLGIRRGLRATGANAAIEGVRQGQTANEITGHMGEDIIQARLHPWLGPGIGFGITALSGKRFDLRSSPTPMIAKNVGGGAQYAENARVALENQNPLLYAVLSPALGPAEGQEDDSLLTKMRKGLLKGPASAFGVQDLKSPALKYLDEKIGATMPQVTATGDRQTASKSIITKERAGQSAAEDMRRAREEGVLSPADIQRLRKAGKLSALEAKVENIHRGYGVEGVLDFYERFANDLTPEERNGVQRILRRAKLTIASHPLNQRGTAAQKAERMNRLNSALAGPSVPAQP